MLFLHSFELVYHGIEQNFLVLEFGITEHTFLGSSHVNAYVPKILELSS